MPALNFQPRFAALVESGKKRQTIRARRKDGRDPMPGDTLYLYTGMRTKRCRKLATVTCASVGRIALRSAWPDCPVLLWLERLGRSGHPIECSTLMWEAEQFAKEDGFASFHEMVGWFDAVHGLPFDGLVIRW